MAEKKGITDWIRKVLEDYTETSEEAYKKRQEHKKTTCPQDTYTTWYEEREKAKKRKEPFVPGSYDNE